MRCGACNEVFDGNATLTDLDGVAPERAPGAEAEAAPEPSASAAFDADIAALEVADAASSEPVYTLDFDTTFDPFGILPDSGLPEQETEPEAQAEPPVDAAVPLEPEAAEAETETETEPSPVEEPDELAGAGPDASNEPDPDPAPQHDAPVAEGEAPEALEPRLQRASSAGQAVEPVIEAPPEPEMEEPDFVRRSRLQEKAGRNRRILMTVGSLVLLAALVAQGATTFRNVLAAQFPQLTPALASTCDLLGCRVELPAQIDTLSVETGELQALGANTFSLGTLLRNQGSLAQAWPSLELALTDANDKPLLRRVFAPAEYLPPGTAPAKGFAARSEQPVKLHFELNQLKASGYRIAIFYP